MDDEPDVVANRRDRRSRPASGMQAARSAVREATRAEDRDEGENFEGREEGKRRRRFRNRLEDEDDVDGSFTIEQDERRGGRLPSEEEKQRFRNELFHDVVPARDDGSVGPPPPRPLMPIAWARAGEARENPLALIPTRDQRAHFIEESTNVHNLLRSRAVSRIPRPFDSIDVFVADMKRRGAMLETQERVSADDDNSEDTVGKRHQFRFMFQITPEAFVAVVISLSDTGAALIDEWFYWPAHAGNN
jgi:hypothetical protein